MTQMDKIIELAREAGFSGSVAKMWSKHFESFYTLARADYETKLSAVMPADFKDWHENNRSEWPDIAAWVITNLREQRADLEAEVFRLREHIIDQTKLEQANAKLRFALDAVYRTCDWYGDDGREALRSALAQQDQDESDSLTIAYLSGYDKGKKDALSQQGEQQPVAWYLPQGADDSLFRDHRTVVACTGNKWHGWIPLYAGAAPAAQPCCKGKMELENFLQELSKQSGWASTVIRKYLNEMSSKEE